MLLRARACALLGLGVALGGLQLATLPAAQANTAGTGLVISEVYGAGGNAGAARNADFVELYNPTTAAIALDGKTLQYRSASGGVGGTVTLTGSVPAGRPFLVQMSAAGSAGASIGTPDQTASPAIGMAAGGGQVILGTATTYPATGNFTGAADVLDMTGAGAATSFETAASVEASATQSLNRSANGGDTDSNAVDLTLATPSPTPAVAVVQGPLAATDPGANTATTGEAIAPFTLAATGGTPPYTWSAQGLPAGLSISSAGTISGTPLAPGASTVNATVSDSASPTRATASRSFTITVSDAPAAAVVTIAQIQGDNTDVSPQAGTRVTTTGVVTAAYPTGGLNGFFLQTGGPDTTPNASDGIFVYGGTLGFSTYPGVGSTQTVTGSVSEFNGQTQVTATGVVPAATAQPAVVAKTVVPGTDCALPGTGCLAGADLNAAREKTEGEAFKPTGYTVTDAYDGSPAPSTSSSFFGEIGLAANSSTALVQPTELFDVQTQAAQIADRTKYNDAHRMILDDGATLTYSQTVNADKPLPWFTADHYVRNGAGVTFDQPVVLTWSFGDWKLEPSGGQVVGKPSGKVTFAQNRPAAPGNVGGDVKLATFNVLNYFPTTGEEYVAAGGGNACTFFSDRAGARVTTRACGNPSTSSGNGPRGAADAPNLKRQQDKIVKAINGLDASIVSLEEIENSAKFGKNRDDALGRLVAALNAAAGSDTWDYVRSPADRPAAAQEDVIRTGFIYKPATISPVGVSVILQDEENFDNAREPLAQAFKAAGAADSSAFGVIVNHFKSKGDSNPVQTGPNANGPQGAFNADRVAQAQALDAFADTFQASRDIEAMFLSGDFNSYTEEDPVQALRAGGWTPLESTTNPGEESYNFAGLDGSLDHVFANPAAQAMVTGVDIWNINADESVYYEYSRFNYNVSNLYVDNQFRASDHNPEIVGLALNTPVNLLNINDFHGRIDENTTRFATTIERLKAQYGDASSLFLSAGDNIGASLFASALQNDDPTLDVLNALDLKTSAVGNHEFDKGFSDLTGRVSQRAGFTYLGANVYRKGTTDPALPQYRTFNVNGIRVGVVGVVTQETPSLVSPAGIADLDFGDPVAAVNRVAAQLSDGRSGNGEADVIVAEYHEGSGSGSEADSCASDLGGTSTFGRIARDTSAQVDAIFTGHTHKFYACDGPIPGVSGATRPILQTGSYGENIGQIVLSVDPDTKTVTSYSRRNVARSATENLDSPRVAEVKRITDAALAEAARVGNTPVGRISADITTAYSGTTRDNRAAESALGDTVANALRDGVSSFADADLGVTNPGGLRAELFFKGTAGTAPAANPADTDGVVTFAEANAVLPFNNTVAIVKLTGTQLKQVLEQQYQTNPDGSTASRPYLQLGLSDNVRVTSDPTKPAGARITSVFVDDFPLDTARTYTISTLSFLATGGDNFRAFTQGSFVDTGLLDAELWRTFLATGTATTPIQPDFARQQVFTAGAPATLTIGQRAQFVLGPDLAAPAQPNTGETLNIASLGAPANTSVVAAIGATTVGTYQVTNGSASIDLTIPTSFATAGTVTFTALPSGTKVTIPFAPASSTTPTIPMTPPVIPPVPTTPTTPTAVEPKVKVKVLGGEIIRGVTRPVLKLTVKTADGSTATGKVKIKVPGQKTLTVKIKNGKIKVRLGVLRKLGLTTVKVTYLGNATTPKSTEKIKLKVTRP